MSNRDVGIRGTSTFIGVRTPEEVKEDENHRRRVEAMLHPKVPPEENLGELLIRTTPTLNLMGTPKEVTKEAKGFKSQKEYENHLVKSPSKHDHEKAFNMGNKILKVSAAERDRGAKQWMTRGGRDPNGRSLDQESKIAKDAWLKNQKTNAQLKALKEHHHPTPVGLGNQYRSDTRTPVQKKRDSYNAKVEANKGNYIEWYDRMAQEEAESLNNIKRTTWEQGGRVRPEPKYVSAQDVINVYKPKAPEATPLQVKKLHQRLQNHNERTGEFKNLPKEDKELIKFALEERPEPVIKNPILLKAINEDNK